MKSAYLLIIILCFVNLISAQSLIIHKTDQSTQSFNLVDIDSISISAAALGSCSSISGSNCIQNSPDRIAAGLLPVNIQEKNSVQGLDDRGIGDYYAAHLNKNKYNSISSSLIYLKRNGITE